MVQIRLLLADGSSERARVIQQRLIEGGGPDLEIIQVRTEADLQHALEDRPANGVILAEHFAGEAPRPLLHRLEPALDRCPVLVLVEESSRLGPGLNCMPIAAAIDDGEALWQRVQSLLTHARTTPEPASTAVPAATDEVSGLLTREYFTYCLGRGPIGVPPRAPVACILVQTGDAVAPEAPTSAVRQAVRELRQVNQIAVRWAPNQFLFVAKNTTLTEAWMWCESARQRLDQAAGNEDDTTATSFGIAGFQGEELSEDTIELAEAALELAAAEGGGAIRSWDWVEVESVLTEVAGRTDLDIVGCYHAFTDGCGYLLGPCQQYHLTAHCEQVSDLATRLAGLLPTDPATVDRVRVAGLLHDIGKCVIPEQLLAKPASLSLPEWSLMGQHAAIGAEIGHRLGADPQIVQFILHHHTRYDAANPMVPMGARILCVADALVTMSTPRAYGQTMPAYEALAEVARESGRQFHPEVVAAAHRAGPGFMTKAA